MPIKLALLCDLIAELVHFSNKRFVYIKSPFCYFQALTTSDFFQQATNNPTQLRVSYPYSFPYNIKPIPSHKR